MATARGCHPLFVKHTDMGLTMHQQLKEIDLCKDIWKVIQREELEGVQRIGGLWRIYITTEPARIKLLSEGFSYKGLSVSIYEQNPFRRAEENIDPSKRTTKVTVSNLPLSIANEEIKIMLVRLGCKLETEVEYEFIRDDDRKLTSIKNGNRSVLVESDYLQNNPLPRNSFCASWRCNIFYYNQPRPTMKCYNCGKNGHTIRNCREDRACKVCGATGHYEGTDDCSHYQQNDSFLFGGAKDKLSNFFPCSVPWKGQEFRSAEHAYIYEKAMYHNRTDIAATMVRSKDAVEAKNEAKKIVTQKKWEEKKEEIMNEVIKSKLESNKDIESELMETGERLLGEAVIGQDEWGVGLAKRTAAHTNPEKWPGKNRLGKMYMDMRRKLRERNEQFTLVEGGKRKAQDDETFATPSTSKLRPCGTTPNKDTSDNSMIQSNKETSQRSYPVQETS